MGSADDRELLRKEEIANEAKHWVRAVTACNSRCLFCLDSDTPRGVFIPSDEVRADLRRGIEERGASRVVISGGEATLHPEFVDFVAYARDLGYRKVQTVTNGYKLGEMPFLAAALDAGLSEITYSLHGHTAELHDRLTGTPGAFRRITRAIVRSLEDGRPIVNVDVCINKQNVAVLDRVVELAMALGVREFDLLHVIPQAAAFENRDQLFYDPLEHLDVLHRVFRLARHPRVTVWTNRFPVPFLEGLEDLIQDPHKMLDEINGRRFQVQRYLDVGEPLDCRDPERCPHCFIAPMCTTMDDTAARQREAGFEVWDVGRTPARDALPAGEMPFGTTRLGVTVDGREELEELLRDAPAPLEVTTDASFSLEGLEGPALRLHARTADQLEAWIAAVPATSPHEVVIALRSANAPWLLDHGPLLAAHADRLRIHQPSHEHLRTAKEEDVRHVRAFFEALREAVGRPLPVSGLPSCLVPGMEPVEAPPTVERTLFDDAGRPIIRELARLHVRRHYRVKSLRCRTCRVEERCHGAHVQLVRDQGLAILRPWEEGAEAERMEAAVQRIHPEPLRDVARGAPPVGASPSLPGFDQPTEAVRDPLGLIAEQRLLRRRRRAADA